MKINVRKIHRRENIVIYCSSAFKKSLNIGKEEIVESSEIKEEELFCWHAHIKKVNGRNTIVLMNDYAHAFFMDNISWNKEDCYYPTLIDEEDRYRHTSDYTLDVVEVGDEFRFIFDFGDEWTFQCKVLKEEEEKTINYPEIIKTVVESPEQYPNYDEFE